MCTTVATMTTAPNFIYRVYQNYWSDLEVEYIHKYDEETYKYR